MFAPDKPQLHVINHVKGEVMEGETRYSFIIIFTLVENFTLAYVLITFFPEMF